MKCNIDFLGVVRDCFKPSSIVLGPADDPITPEPKCNMQIIYEDINACLCNSNLCNLNYSKNGNERIPRTRISATEIIKSKDAFDEIPEIFDGNWNISVMKLKKNLLVLVLFNFKNI